MNKVECITENHYYVTDENFKVGLGKEESPKTQLGLLFEVFNPSDACMEKADFDYTLGILASIVLHKEDLMDTVFNDYGGVDCQDILSGKDIKEYVASLTKVESFENEDTEIPPIIFDDSMRSISLPLMTDDEDIMVAFLNKVVELNFGGMAITIGFRLDNPVNLIGNTGWDLLEMQRTGEDLITKRIKNL